MFQFMQQQVGRASAPPNQHMLPPTSPAEGNGKWRWVSFFKLKHGSSEATLTPDGCHEQIAPYGHITPDGIPIRDLVGTGSSISCLAHLTWWQYRATCVALSPYHQVIRSANRKPLPTAGQTQYLWLKWSSATGHSSFVFIMGLAGPPAHIGMDLIVPLWVQIDAASCTVIPQSMHTLQHRRIWPKPPPLPASPPKRQSRPILPPPPWTPLGRSWLHCCRGCRFRPNLYALVELHYLLRAQPRAALVCVLISNCGEWTRCVGRTPQSSDRACLAPCWSLSGPNWGCRVRGTSGEHGWC